MDRRVYRGPPRGVARAEQRRLRLGVDLRRGDVVRERVVEAAAAHGRAAAEETREERRHAIERPGERTVDLFRRFVVASALVEQARQPDARFRVARLDLE